MFLTISKCILCLEFLNYIHKFLKLIFKTLCVENYIIFAKYVESNLLNLIYQILNFWKHVYVTFDTFM